MEGSYNARRVSQFFASSDDFSTPEEYLKYFKANRQKFIKAAAKDESISKTRIKLAEIELENTTKLLELYKTKEYPYPKGKLILPRDPKYLQESVIANLLADAKSTYRLRNVTAITDLTTFEDLEEDISDYLNKCIEKNTPPGLIFVDSITSARPREALEQNTSSDGSNFLDAKYLNRWLPKLQDLLKKSEYTAIFVQQENKSIKMNQYAPNNPLDDFSSRGGGAPKFYASQFIKVERKTKEMTALTGESVQAASISFLKNKISGGNNSENKEGTRSTFLVKISPSGDRYLDFAEPYIQDKFEALGTNLVFDSEPSMGIFKWKARKTFFVPL